MDTDRKDTNIQIGKRVREARRDMNIDKAEIAEVLGVTVEHYRKLCRCRSGYLISITDYSKISRNINDLMNICNFMKENEGTLVNMNHHIEKQEKEIDLVNLRKA